jgi:hypothetical protein
MKINILAKAFIFGLLLTANAYADDNSLNTILNAINLLEKKSEPKCYATASRLEDFMFGTPLDSDARFAKNILQKQFIENIWIKAAKLAKADGEDTVLKQHITTAVTEIFTVKKDKNNHWTLIFGQGSSITLHKDDKRQYASIAYSLRAILAVQQAALLNVDVDFDLLPLTEKAIDKLKNSLDFYSLSVLKLADNKAKIQNERVITVVNINNIWQSLANFKKTPDVAPKRDYPLIDPYLLKQAAEKKLTAYAAYNKVNNQLFLRNLQVYFARISWPTDKKESEAIIADFTTLMTAFSANLYSGAQAIAMKKGLSTISEESVYDFSMQFIPHKTNEYEDALFFHNLLKKQQVYIESYDMDAFRDAGIHWQYLTQAVLSPDFKTYIEPDPFAAELLVENIAQYGVLLLRIAGEYAIQQNEERLKASHLTQAKEILAQKTALHHSTKPHKESIIALASAAEQSKSQSFSDVTAASGILFEHKSSDWLNRQLRSFIKKDALTGIITIPPAFGGSGVAAEDINNDGYVDVLLLGGRGNKLYINQQDGSFLEKSKEYGLNWVRPQDNLPGEVRQPLIADIDNDGWQDIIITYVNDQHRVYKNIQGKRFEDMSSIAKLNGTDLVGGPATLFDLDNDGDLDLYITYFGNYIKGDLPTLKRDNSNGLANQLFENIGGFQFKNITQNSGVDNTGWSQAVTHTDLNNDNWQDLIVGNDFGVNAYYINQKNGRFKEVSNQLGTDKPSYTMGIGIADLNADQLPDIYVSNIVIMNKDESYILPNQDTVLKFDLDKLAHMRVIEANDLFISNQKQGELAYQVSHTVGRGYSSTGWSWDADFFDYDLDGDDDLYVLNGMNEFNLYSSRNPYYRDPNNNALTQALIPVSSQERNVFFENSHGTLNNKSKETGLDLLGNSRSASYFDSDNDGDLDIIVNNYHEPAVLFNNNLTAEHRHWLKIKLHGNPEKNVTRDAIGAKVIVTLPNGKILWREIRSTDGYMSVHPKVQHFGLGDAQRVQVKVIWPNGKKQYLNDIKVDQLFEIQL